MAIPVSLPIFNISSQECQGIEHSLVMLNREVLLKKRMFVRGFSIKRRYKASLDIALYLQPEIVCQIHS